MTAATEKNLAWSVWDGATQETNQGVEPDIAAARLRAFRDHRVATDIDPISNDPARWNALTIEQQTMLRAYHHALLSLELQAGFPHDVLWPSKPF